MADLKVLLVPGYNIILGCDWIASLGNVTMNLGQGLIMVEIEGEKVKLCTEQAKTEVRVLDEFLDVAKEQKQDSQIFFAQLFHMEEEKGLSQTKIDPQLKMVLDSYPEVFAEPKILPPKRAVDHQITLKSDAKAINLRPYRFSYFQKLEIERITHELLQQSLIQPSTSSYSSSVLLVKKKDGSWRMCVDYRRLKRK
jgi:hypothetical protein